MPIFDWYSTVYFSGLDFYEISFIITHSCIKIFHYNYEVGLAATIGT